MQKQLNCVRSERFLDGCFTGSTKFKHLSWTYYVFNDLKIIVMGNGRDILRAFLLEPVNEIWSQGAYMDRRTSTI